MATVVVIAYSDEDTAEQARATVWQLEEDLIIQADEVAVIFRDPEGKYHVDTTAGDCSGRGLVAMSGARGESS